MRAMTVFCLGQLKKRHQARSGGVCFPSKKNTIGPFFLFRTGIKKVWLICKANRLFSEIYWWDQIENP